jgi:hypothetical protein
MRISWKTASFMTNAKDGKESEQNNESGVNKE